MPIKYTDIQISEMVQERKPLPENYLSKMQLRDKRGHKERELDIICLDGNQYRIIIRQSNHNPNDFSIILGVLLPDSNQIFRLLRYNGKSHEHTNHIEKNRFYDFHIHKATERYQEYGTREDAYAEPTNRFTDFNSALQCMIEDCGFEVPDGIQLPLFER